MTVRVKAYLYIIAAMALWGSAAPIIKFTLNGIDPLPFLAYRFLISAIIGIIVLKFFRPKLPKTVHGWSMISLYGLLATTIALGFLFEGLDRTTVLELGLISVVSPLIVILGGGILLGERVTKRERMGISLAILGTAITIIAPAILGGEIFRFSGNVLLVLYLLADTSSILLAKKLMREKFSPLAMTNFAFILGALTIIPYTFYFYGGMDIIRQIIIMPIHYHMGVWYMAIVSGSLAYYLFIRGTRSIEAGEASLFFYLQPLFSIPLAVFWLKETLTTAYIIGAGVIAIGVYIAETKNRK